MQSGEDIVKLQIVFNHKLSGTLQDNRDLEQCPQATIEELMGLLLFMMSLTELHSSI